MSSRAKRTYGSRPSRNISETPSSPPPSGLSSSPPPFEPNHNGDEHVRSDLKRKRPLPDDITTNAPQHKRSSFLIQPRLFPSSSGRMKLNVKKKGAKSQDDMKTKQKQLTQLHFSLDTSVLRTCTTCSLTYTRGAPDDESLHRAHCARVQKGMEWGKEEEREAKNGKVSVEEVRSEVKLRNGAKGRVICFRADVGGKIGSKLSTLVETINITLSAPPLPEESLQTSKVYLFLLSTPSSPSSSATPREKIVGCVIAQRISTAMAIAPDAESTASDSPLSLTTTAKHQTSSTSLKFLPTPLPTPLGIPRLFVSSTHRRLGVASALLDAAAETFILGCPLDPKKGEVAFTQPTGLGSMVLEKWAGGNGRVYEE